MDVSTHRRLNGVVGAVLLVAVLALVTAFGGGFGIEVVTLQVALLVVAGVLDVVAAVDTAVTERVPWYRLTGSANVALGVAVPVGFADTLGGDGDGLLVFGVTGLGGLALALIGLDMLVYDGRHVFENSLAPTSAPELE